MQVEMQNKDVSAVLGDSLKDPDRMVIVRAIKCCESALGCEDIIPCDEQL
jgi:hypothetical protein